MDSPDIGKVNEHAHLEQEIKRYHGFSGVKHLRKGASGIAFYVVDEKSKQEALLKMAPESTGEPASTIRNELEVVTEGRRESQGLNKITGYPLGQAPEGVTLAPTMRGLAQIKSRPTGMFRIDYKPSILLEWLKESETGESGYRRMDKLIPERYGTWTDLEILDAVAPFAYLLAQAHKQGIIYNDIGADKADHLYWDEQRHQLKVIDWANAVFMTDADYNGARKPLHDVRGLARLIYRMRTNKDINGIERTMKPIDVLMDQEMRRKHHELAVLVYRCLQDPAELTANKLKPITNGDELYTAMEETIRFLRGETQIEPHMSRTEPQVESYAARPPLIFRKPEPARTVSGEQPGRIKITKPEPKPPIKIT